MATICAAVRTQVEAIERTETRAAAFARRLDQKPSRQLKLLVIGAKVHCRDAVGRTQEILQAATSTVST